MLETNLEHIESEKELKDLIENNEKGCCMLWKDGTKNILIFNFGIWILTFLLPQ